MRVNKLKGMYALLVAVAVMIGITIYGSCSADEEFDGYSPQDELYTLADRTTRSEMEGPEVSQFPTVDEILASTVVKNKLNVLWEETKSLASPAGRQELAIFIRYNKASHQYSFSETIYGDTIGCDTNARLRVNIDPPSDMCAFFHTHTTLEYCPGKKRKTGPTDLDISFVNNYGIPGILYDYKVNTLRGGMSKNKTKKISKYGAFNQRLD
ncbi:MAG: hypothetical protein IKN15_06110 [Bacteroidaceae bacterium]|jgi:hypothetical protein|nr:hypothetical protein [Bacteroidaceae bacterium]